jgi:hypothetical protein
MYCLVLNIAHSSRLMQTQGGWRMVKVGRLGGRACAALARYRGRPRQVAPPDLMTGGTMVQWLAQHATWLTGWYFASSRASCPGNVAAAGPPASEPPPGSGKGWGRPLRVLSGSMRGSQGLVQA